MVVTGQVAAGGLHQEIVDGLVDPGAVLDEVVLDGRQRRHDADLEPGLLAHLADRRLLDGLTASGVPFGSVQVTASRPRRRMPTTSEEPILSADDDAAG